jgi:hypothetical protein
MSAMPGDVAAANLPLWMEVWLMTWKKAQVSDNQIAAKTSIWPASAEREAIAPLALSLIAPTRQKYTQQPLLRNLFPEHH